MKKLIDVNEGVGLDGLLGEKVLLMCSAYFYTGTLSGVNDVFVELENPAIVYETGPWTNKNYTDVQPMNVPKWYVQRSAIESYGLSK